MNKIAVKASVSIHQSSNRTTSWLLLVERFVVYSIKNFSVLRIETVYRKVTQWKLLNRWHSFAIVGFAVVVVAFEIIYLQPEVHECC